MQGSWHGLKVIGKGHIVCYSQPLVDMVWVCGCGPWGMLLVTRQHHSGNRKGSQRTNGWHVDVNLGTTTFSM